MKYGRLTLLNLTTDLHLFFITTTTADKLDNKSPSLGQRARIKEAMCNISDLQMVLWSIAYNQNREALCLSYDSAPSSMTPPLPTFGCEARNDHLTSEEDVE